MLTLREINHSSFAVPGKQTRDGPLLTHTWHRLGEEAQGHGAAHTALERGSGCCGHTRAEAWCALIFCSEVLTTFVCAVGCVGPTRALSLSCHCLSVKGKNNTARPPISQQADEGKESYSWKGRECEPAFNSAEVLNRLPGHFRGRQIPDLSNWTSADFRRKAIGAAHFRTHFSPRSVTGT